MVDVHSKSYLSSAENDAFLEDVFERASEDEALIVMKEKLPGYVVDSFIATGFDTLKVISEIDTSADIYLK